MSELKVSDNDKILIIAPHPDDESIGVGGLISRFGSQCDVWVVTDGSKANMDNEPQEIANIRKNEFELAMRIGKVNDFCWIGIEDRNVSYNLEVIRREELSEYSKVFIPSSDEHHIDHVATCIVALKTLRQLNNIEIYYYEITSPMKSYSHYLEIKDYVENKRNLIGAYKSQNQIFDYADASISLNRFRADMEGLRNSYIEVFRLLKPNHISPYGELRVENERLSKLVNILSRLILVEKTMGGISELIHEQGYEKIDLYGYGLLGRCLCELLDASNVKVNSIIDRKFVENNGRYVSLKEYKQKSDAILVTVLSDTMTIVDELRNQGVSHIITVEQLLDFSEDK